MRYLVKSGTGIVVALILIVQASVSVAKSAPDSFADLAERLLPMVVNISTTTVIEGREGPVMPQLPPGSPFEDFFKEFFDRNQGQQRQRRATSLGSGFIISNDGYVVTNNHVIQGADEITVILHDDTQLEAEIIGFDPKTDLALLKVKFEGDLPAAKFGDSDKSRVGDWIVAIGNPFGLGGTVTAGIISARGRDINSGPYDEYIQTDASINRGNSGGPMFNLDGDVVGINTAIFSPSGGSVGIGFAIPSNVAKNVIDQLIEHGTVKRGWLGVHIQDVSDEIAETLGMSEASGALVANVMEDGPAATSGIKPGDVILTFNNRKVSEMRRLPKIVADTPVGKKVDVDVWRDGKQVTLQVEVGVLDDEVIAASTSGGGSGMKEIRIEKLGLSVAGFTDEIREQFQLEDAAKGVIVIAVDDEGPAADKDVRPGDLIVEVSQSEVSEPGQIAKAVEDAEAAGRKSVLLLIEGQAGLRFVALRIGQE
ncbi:MAG: Do family serine endopeptidase [Rhodospirillales bacterium]|jgi:serine protease Do|nr:Do family serine endopeptidase [Rhodospirillales bacterium]MBT4041440.1 Do family serine endopeptidase [Rhodospirillales bacterium]MBT4627723.1 Do family serine endopeptidase [Rhodospirillales bacterium]MBT5521464.1 Do family serine endopeptidase [Rhodospirillales bacterium]MBT6109706.1 Do family serine endopeptidase [Rhodospirillales bacterium]